MSSQLWEDPNVLKNLEELFPGLTLEEALQHQESLYQSLQMIGCIYHTSRSRDNESSYSHGRSVRESSLSGFDDHDMALDEALARSLQELELKDDQVDPVAISESLNLPNMPKGGEHIF